VRGFKWISDEAVKSNLIPIADEEIVTQLNKRQDYSNEVWSVEQISTYFDNFSKTYDGTTTEDTWPAPFYIQKWVLD